MGKKIIFLIFLGFLAVTPMAFAQQEPEQDTLAVDTPAKSSSGLPIPRFVSLATDKVFVRTGPALRYPVKWVLHKEHLPVEIVQEFDTWRKIRDLEGAEGWVHQSMLSGNRYVVIKGEENLAVRKSPNDESRMVALLEPFVLATLEGCENGWCKVEAQGYKGYAKRKFLWGIYASEEFH